MDIREHYISSFFFHLIAILLIAAVSQNHRGLPDALTVSLSSDNFGGLSKTEQTKAVETREIVAPEIPAAAEKAAPGAAESADGPEVVNEVKPAAVSEPAQATEVPQTLASGMPGSGQEGIWLRQIHHVYVMHARAYVENASQSIQKSLLKEIENDSSGGLRDGTAEVTFYFNDRGGIGEIWGASDSEKLEGALKGLNWGAIPLPNDYRIRLRALKIQIKIVRGEPSLHALIM